MTVQKISEIHLSLIRTFSYDIQDTPEKGPFNFLKDKKKYYEILMTHDKRLSERNIFLHGIGKFRSVLDLKDWTVSDPFFSRFKDYYRRLGEIKEKSMRERIVDRIRSPSSIQLFITPHYPCVLDVFPSKNRKYEMITYTLPGSLQTATDVKMSFSIRIYPAGLASLRLGWYFSTEDCFDVNDIIEFLRNKRAQIEIKARAINSPKPRYQKFSIDKFTKYYARMLKWGLLGKEPSQPSWEFSHSIIHVVKSDPLSIEKNYRDILLPLLCLEKRPDEKERLILNLGKRSDEIFLPGSKSFVIYSPYTEIWERRKIRRWLRNIIEFFSIQKYLIREVHTIKIKDIFDELKRRNILYELRNGLLPPNINNLFSIWNYLNLKYEPYPMEGRWRSRYDEILKIWDKTDEIKNTKEQTFTMIEKTVNEAAEASKKLGHLFNTIIENVDKVGKIIPKSS